MSNNNREDRVVVIGGDGLVGESLCRTLSSTFSVIKITRSNCSMMMESVINDEEFYCQCVIFTAQSPDYKNQIFSEDIMGINITLLHKALITFSGKARQFIYFSTGGVYCDSNEEIYEDSQVKTLDKSPYIVSKIAGELIANTFSDCYEKMAILRPFFIYGRRQNKQMLFQQLVTKLKNNETIEIGSNGGLYFNPIYVDDVSKIVTAIIQDNKKGLIIRNICGPDTLRLDNVIVMFADMLKVEQTIKVNKNEPVFVLAKSKYQYIDNYVPFTKGIRDYAG